QPPAGSTRPPLTRIRPWQVSPDRLATPCCTASIGGKSRVGLGGFDPHLDGGFIRQASELAQHVPTAFLRIVDPMPVAGVIDGLSHVVQRPLERLPHPPPQFNRINLLKPIHGNSFPASPCRNNKSYPRLKN